MIKINAEKAKKDEAVRMIKKDSDEQKNSI